MLRPPRTPTHLLPPPRPRSPPLAPVLRLSSTTEAHRPPPSSPSPLRGPPPPSRPSPLRRLRWLRPVRLLRPRRHSSSSSPRPSPPSPQPLPLPANLRSCLPPPLLLKGHSHLVRPPHPLNRDLFLPPAPLVLLSPPAITRARCLPRSSPLHPSPLLTTQAPHLPALTCPPLLWLKATTCLQAPRGRQACLGPCCLRASPVWGEDSLPSRTVSSLSGESPQPGAGPPPPLTGLCFHRRLWPSQRPPAWVCRPVSGATKLRSPCASSGSCPPSTEATGPRRHPQPGKHQSAPPHPWNGVRSLW